MTRFPRARRITTGAALVAAFCLVALVSAASAAPPANDSFAAAQPISGPSGTVSGTNVEATREPGEPEHAEEAGGGRSVWYRWTAPATGDFVFDTCGSGFDTLLALYTGSSVPALTQVASNDDGCAEQSVVVVPATAGTVYSIAVDGYRDDTGIATGTFRLRWRPVTTPPNDDFAAAQPLSGDRGTVDGDNLAAQAEPGERPPLDAIGASVWYTWTPPFTGAATFETCGSSYDTILAVYTGTSVASLTRVAANDDRCRLQSRVRFLARAGTTYRILVDGIDETPRGFITLSWLLVRRPANDDFASARRITGVRGSLTASNAGALAEAREPNHAGFDASASMWYRWRAPRSMGVSFDTCASTFDTLLAVYRGTALRRLVRVAANDDACPPGTGSRVDLVATKGVDYVLAVDGLLDATGSFTLRWRPAGASAAPCRVPDVRGLTLSRARVALEGAGCRLGRVEHSHSRLVRRGRVISQSPTAGRRVRFLTRVSVDVSLGRGP